MTRGFCTSVCWQFWIDRGRVVAPGVPGKLVIHKLLSENPERHTDAPVQGIGIFWVPVDAPIPSASDCRSEMGTTAATNDCWNAKAIASPRLGYQRFTPQELLSYEYLRSRQILLPEPAACKGASNSGSRRTLHRLGEELTLVNLNAVSPTLQTAYNDVRPSDCIDARLPFPTPW